MARSKAPVPGAKRRKEALTPVEQLSAYANKYGVFIVFGITILASIYLAIPVDKEGAAAASKAQANARLLALAKVGDAAALTEARRLLTEGGVEVNTLDADQLTPLFYACMAGRKDMAELLIRSGAGVNANSGGRHPLLSTCQGIDIESFDGATGEAAQSAYTQARRDIAKLLVSAGADVLSDSLSVGACAEDKHPEFAQELKDIQERLLVEEEAQFGKAVKAGRKELKKVALPSAVQYSPLFARVGRMVLRGDTDEVVLPLLTRAVKNTLVGSAMLEAAARHGDLGVSRRLLAAGVNPDKSPYARPSIVHATLHGRIEVVKLLLEHKASLDVLMEGKDGLQSVPALVFACMGNPQNPKNNESDDARAAIVELMLDAGAVISDPMLQLKTCAGRDIKSFVRTAGADSDPVAATQTDTATTE